MAITKPVVYHFSPFENNELGHGGCKRTNQIITALSEKYRVVSLGVKVPKVSFSFQSLAFGLVYYILFGLPFKFNLKGIIRLGAYIKVVDLVLLNLNASDTLVSENHTGFGYCLNRLAVRKGMKLISVIHNIESLVPTNRSRFSNLSSRLWFQEEIDTLALSDLSVTISREEDWLLKLYGINSYFFKYDTPKAVIQKNREKLNVSLRDDQRYLILGTVNNPPTKIGTIELLNLLRFLPGKFHVAGYGTESLDFDFQECPHIVLEGSVSHDRLIYLLSICKYSIVHQVPTSGVLTRINELLQYNMIVFANVSAARSYYCEENLKIYSTMDELRMLITDEYFSEETPFINQLELVIKG